MTPHSKYCEELKQRFFNQGFRLELIYSRKKAVEETDKKEILKERDNTTSKKTKILLA